MRLSFEKFMDGINEQCTARALPQYPYVFVYDADKGVNLRQRKVFHPEHGWEVTEEKNGVLDACKAWYISFEAMDLSEIIPVMSTIDEAGTGFMLTYAARSYIKGVSSD